MRQNFHPCKVSIEVTRPPNADEVYDFWSRGVNGHGLDYSAARTSDRTYTQQVVPADVNRRFEIIDAGFNRLHQEKIAEKAYLDAISASEAQFLAATTAAEATRAQTMSLANATRDAAGSAAWASALSTLAATSSNPWLSYAAAEASANAAYDTAIAPAVVTYVTTLAESEGTAAKTEQKIRSLEQERAYYVDYDQQLLRTQETYSYAVSMSSGFISERVHALGALQSAATSALPASTQTQGSVTARQTGPSKPTTPNKPARPSVSANELPTDWKKELEPVQAPGDVTIPEPNANRKRLPFHSAEKLDLPQEIQDRMAKDAKKESYIREIQTDGEIFRFERRDFITVKNRIVYWNVRTSISESIPIAIGELLANDWVAIKPEFGGGRATLRSLQILAAKINVNPTENPNQTLQLAIASVRSPFTIVDGSTSIGIFLDGTGNHLESITNTTRMYNVYQGSKFYYGGVGNFIDWADLLPGRHGMPTLAGGEFTSGNASGFGWQQVLLRARNDIEDYFNEYHAKTGIAPEQLAATLKLDLFGFSRGAAMANILATWLHEKGIFVGGKKVFPQVRFMGLFDPVYSFDYPGQGSAMISGRNPEQNTVEAKLPPNVHSAAVLAGMHEERTYFPATVFIPGKDSPVVANKSLYQYTMPGAHCEVGGHYTSNLNNQQLSFYSMVELAKRAGVPLGDGKQLDSQLQQFYESPFLRLLSGTTYVKYNSKMESIDTFASDISESGLAKQFDIAKQKKYWKVPSKAEMEALLKKRSEGDWKPAEIGVQIEANPANWRPSERLVDNYDKNDQLTQHLERKLFGYQYASELHPEWHPYFSFFSQLDKKRMHPKGKEGFAP